MSDPVKAALILGAAFIVAVGLWIYFSPYQTCVRAGHDRGVQYAEIRCAAALAGRP